MGCFCSLPSNLASIKFTGNRVCKEKGELITFNFSGHHSRLLITYWHWQALMSPSCIGVLWLKINDMPCSTTCGLTRDGCKFELKRRFLPNICAHWEKVRISLKDITLLLVLLLLSWRWTTIGCERSGPHTKAQLIDWLIVKKSSPRIF